MKWAFALLLACSLCWPAAVSARHTKHWLGTVRVTQYLPTGYRTASGVWPFYGEVAADPSIPFGAHITVPGLGTYIVLDRGGAVYGKHIDVFVWRLNYAIHDWYSGVYWQN